MAAGLAVLTMSLAGCLPPRPFDEEAWRAKVAAQDPAALYAPHRRPDGAFFNPWQPEDRSRWSFWRWVLSRNSLGEDAGNDPDTPVQANDGAYLRDSNAPDSLTWVGHATFALQWSGQVVLTDPFFSQRAAVVKRKVPAPFGPQAVPEGAVVLISHNHYDHLDADSLEALLPRAGVTLCPLGLGPLLRELGAKEVRELDWWQSVEVGGTRFTCLPAQHWTRRLGQGYNEVLWCAWLMERGGRKIFFGADSGYFVGYREIGRRYPGIDLALLPMGAYQPRWFMHYAHMNPPEVVQAFQDLGARLLIPMQWGVMPLGDEPPAWPLKDLENYLRDRPKLKTRLQALPVGGRLMLKPEPGGRREGETPPA